MTWTPTIQVPPENYRFEKYCQKHAWRNFWYQIRYVLSFQPKTVLEIGPGTGVVTHVLEKNGVDVTTLDIDEAVHPDVIGSVHELPFEDHHFDLVLCSEVLEHIPYELFQPALKEIQRVTKGPAVIGLPNASGVILFTLKLPFLPQVTLFQKIPFFWETHVFEGTHYWETGKKHHSLKQTQKDIEQTGFRVKEKKIYEDDPAHVFFVLES